MIAAFVIFVIASLTDFIDGRIARARGEVSALGAALDPLADKLLIIAALVMLIRMGVIASWDVIAALSIVLREVLVTGLREALSTRGGKLPVTRIAKWKTTAQLLAAGLLVAAAPGGLIGASAAGAGTAALWIAAILTIWSGADYTLRAAKQLHFPNSEDA